MFSLLNLSDCFVLHISNDFYFYYGFLRYCLGRAISACMSLNDNDKTDVMFYKISQSTAEAQATKLIAQTVILFPHCPQGWNWGVLQGFRFCLYYMMCRSDVRRIRCNAKFYTVSWV